MCKYCEPNGHPLKHIQDTHELYKNMNSKAYLIAELQTGGDKHANIRIQSASENKVNRGTFDIYFCPMCGRKLEESDNA